MGSSTGVSASVQSSVRELGRLFNWTSFQRGKGSVSKKTGNHAASSGLM